MKTAVLDTSVILKWYHEEQEENVGAALAIRDAYLQGALSLTVPDLLIYEFANTLRFKKLLAPEEVTVRIHGLWSSGLDVHPVDEALAEAAVHLAFDHDITVYDAAFVALADLLSATLITADISLYKKLEKRHDVVLLAEISGQEC